MKDIPATFDALPPAKLAMDQGKQDNRCLYIKMSKGNSIFSHLGDKVNFTPVDKPSYHIYDETRKHVGYYHITAVQVLVKYLGHVSLNVPARISVRDPRQLDNRQSIMNLWSSTLYTGTIYTMIDLDYTLSTEDKNIDQALIGHYSNKCPNPKSSVDLIAVLERKAYFLKTEIILSDSNYLFMNSLVIVNMIIYYSDFSDLE